MTTNKQILKQISRRLTEVEGVSIMAIPIILGIVEDCLTSKNETFDNAIKLFNETKLRVTGKKSRAKVLSKGTISSLKVILDNYTTEQFVIACENMLKNKWAEETKNQTMAHLVRVDNFNRYLDQGESSNEIDDILEMTK